MVGAAGDQYEAAGRVGEGLTRKACRGLLLVFYKNQFITKNTKTITSVKG